MDGCGSASAWDGTTSNMKRSARIGRRGVRQAEQVEVLVALADDLVTLDGDFTI